MTAASLPWELLAAGADQRYDGEDVSQLEHGLQAAWLAAEEGASEALQLAALLHDIGHLLVEDAGAASLGGLDLRHEARGARYLAAWYGPEITGPIALHVEAKRTLARDPTYAAALSEESARTLALQGGVHDDDEAARFAARRWATEAIALRRWDDLAKDPHAAVPRLEHWLEALKRHARP